MTTSLDTPLSTPLSTVAVVGAAGGVGSATAAALVTGRRVGSLLLLDVAGPALAVVEMDLALLAAGCGSPVQVSSSEGLPAADVVVFAASVPHRDGAARSEFAAENAAILRDVLASLPSSWSGAFLVATNPVDVLATLAHRAIGHSATVLGYVRNDSVRLAQAVAQVTGHPPHQVTAWSLGEHGPGTVPLLDRVTVAGRPLTLTPSQQHAVRALAGTWYDRWQSHRTGRTSMWTTGSGLATLVESWLADEPAPHPVCIPLDPRYELPHAVCLAQPALVGTRRVTPLHWPLTPAQHHAMAKAAATVATEVAEST